jgi:hypothetical protein
MNFLAGFNDADSHHRITAWQVLAWPDHLIDGAGRTETPPCSEEFGRLRNAAGF